MCETREQCRHSRVRPVNDRLTQRGQPPVAVSLRPQLRLEGALWAPSCSLGCGQALCLSALCIRPTTSSVVSNRAANRSTSLSVMGASRRA